VSRADLEAEVAGSTAPSMNRSGFEHGTTDADTATAGEPRSLVEAHRRIYDLSARVKELETALRRREYSDAIRDIEDRAILRDLDVKAAYARHLETAIGELSGHATAVTNDRDAIVAHLGHVEAQLSAMQGQRSYRAFLRMMALLRRTGPIYRVLRYLVRVSMRCLRGLRRLLRRGGQ
jgi:hypothetical protein